MKCPKCGYLGFETGDRCRNCGYDFSLLAGFEPPDLPFRDGPADTGPLPDLTLARPSSESEPGANAPAAVPAAPADRPPVHGPVSPPASPLAQSGTAPYEAPDGAPDESAQVVALRRLAEERTARIAANATARLPLFPSGPDADAPLVTPPVRPRAPLSVRRATPEVPRFRAAPRAAPSPDDHAVPTPAPSRAARATRPAGRTAAGVSARPVRRLVAALIDVVLLGGLDLLVLYFTLEICGLDARQAGLLLRIPFLAFLVLLNGGYLVAFTASGQTVGKMAAGLRVVADDDAPVTIGRAVLRTVVWALSAVPAGLGFLSILASRDRIALHDRLARTRVVTVSSGN